MLFDPAALLEQWPLFLLALGVIVLLKPLLAFLVCLAARKPLRLAVVLGAGEGNIWWILGKTLLKAFVFALTQQDKLPKTILFYNGGAALTCEGSAMLEDLKALEAQGVEILTCGTCLNFYGLTEKLAVGSVTNMYTIAEKLTQAGNVVKP